MFLNWIWGTWRGVWGVSKDINGKSSKSCSHTPKPIDELTVISIGYERSNCVTHHERVIWSKVLSDKHGLVEKSVLVVMW